MPYFVGSVQSINKVVLFERYLLVGLFLFGLVGRLEQFGEEGSMG
jgi:hypothetical protein